MKKLIFFFDENLPISLAQSFNIIEQARGSDEVISTIEVAKLGRGATDESIVRYLSSLKHDCYIITSDRDFQKRDLLPLIMNSSNLGLFLLRFPPGEKNYWGKFQFVVNIWREIKSKALSKPNPIAYKIDARKNSPKFKSESPPSNTDAPYPKSKCDPLSTQFEKSLCVLTAGKP